MPHASGSPTPSANPAGSPGVATHCPYCALQCGTRLTRERRGVSVRPTDFPVNRGGLCQKGWTAPALLDVADRLRHPLLRRDGGLVPVSWETALDTIAARLRAIRAESGPDAVGVFGYSYLEENLDKVQGLAMNGVAPTYASIADFSYPGARPLYIYVKKAHLDAIPGLREFVGEWARSWGKDGPLAGAGFVASPDAIAARNQQAATQFPTLPAGELK